MTDLSLTLAAALGLGAALTVAVLDHAERDDAHRAAYVDCQVDLAAERFVADACMVVVEDCVSFVEDHACTCWLPMEVTP